MKTTDMIKISLLTALIAIGAEIKIPAPVIGVFTLQLSFVLLAGILLGSKKGALASSLYCFGGLFGIPWFAYGGGPSYIFQPTFGFIVAFILASYIVGVFKEKNNSLLSISMGAVIGTIVVWIIGMIYLWLIKTAYLSQDVSFMPLMLSIFSYSLLADAILAILISIVGKRIINILGN